VGEAAFVRLEDPLPSTSPWFDGSRVSVVAARGETVGFQVLDRSGESVSLAIAGDGLQVRGYSVEAFVVKRPSTALYGGGRGRGTYPDALHRTEGAIAAPAYFELEVARDARPGSIVGTLTVGAREVPVELTVAPVTLPPLPAARVWAYEDPRELPDGDRRSSRDLPERRALISDEERACIDVFRAHGVLLSPDLRLPWWPARKELFAGVTDLPVMISTDPAEARVDVQGWIAATQGTGHVPFTIPIDEPRTAESRAAVRALATAVRAAGGGPTTFRYAVTDEPRPEYGDLVDLYISWKAAHLAGDQHARWTYNGAPPYAGSMVLDAYAPGPRTWGWIAWRWEIPTWYVWDALYWHDRHNARRERITAPPLNPRVDPISFDDGEDRGNLDGVLALPAEGAAGCLPTLRLAAVRRGQLDRLLIEAAASCDARTTSQLVERMVPRALGDAGREASWPTTDAAWEQARRDLIALAICAPGSSRTAP